MSVIEAPSTLEEPPVLNETQQRLLDAERYMREHGWCQNVSEDASGRVCLMGALGRARGAGDGTVAAIVAAIAKREPTFAACVCADAHVVTSWNDSICGSGDEALAVLRLAREAAV